MANAGSLLYPQVTGNDLSEEAFAAIRERLLRQRHFDIGMYKNNCIKRRIAKRLRARGAADVPTYLRILTTEPAECDRLIAALSVHVSHFFRNPAIYAVLEEKVLPELLDRGERAGRQVRLWSVGCASGEEPYSLALLLDALDPKGRAAILATDISSDVLVQAREGLYEETRLLEVPAPLRRRHFTEEGGRYRLEERIRRRVRFEQRDILAAGAYPAADLLLCRNVLIYFSRAEQENILCRFAAALPPDGVLVLGQAETLVGAARRFFRTDTAGERIYFREDLPVDSPCS